MGLFSRGKLKKGLAATGCPPVVTCPCCGLTLGSRARAGELPAKLLRCPRCNTRLANPADCSDCGICCVKGGQ